METILGVVNWVKANWADVASAIAYIIAGASVIVKLTPSSKDNELLDKIKKFISKYIAINS